MFVIVFLCCQQLSNRIISSYLYLQQYMSCMSDFECSRYCKNREKSFCRSMECVENETINMKYFLIAQVPVN